MRGAEVERDEHGPLRWRDEASTLLVSAALLVLALVNVWRDDDGPGLRLAWGLLALVLVVDVGRRLLSPPGAFLQEDGRARVRRLGRWLWRRPHERLVPAQDVVEVETHYRLVVLVDRDGGRHVVGAAKQLDQQRVVQWWQRHASEPRDDSTTRGPAGI